MSWALLSLGGLVVLAGIVRLVKGPYRPMS